MLAEFMSSFSRIETNLSSVQQNATQLEYNYLTHKSRRIEVCGKKKSKSSSNVDVAHTAVRSLSLHIQAAFQRSLFHLKKDFINVYFMMKQLEFYRLQNMETAFEKCSDVTVPPSQREEWLQQLSIVKHELDACDDCYQESLKHIHKATGGEAPSTREFESHLRRDCDNIIGVARV